MLTACQNIPETYDFSAALHRLGYARFRDWQQEAVEVLLSKRRLLLVAPTGGGKSLCYQLPASILPGTTLVISPLIALMHDQVQALQQRGIPATFLASSLSASEIKQRMGNIARGVFKLVYVAPERLVYEGFRGLLQSIDCPLIAIDEAHCISEWGHDFRPEYLKIGELLQHMQTSRVLACTATATPVVRDEILGRLGFDTDTPQILRGFARPNLALRVREVASQRDRQQHIDALLEETLGKPRHSKKPGTVIVYAPTRKATEEEANRLLLQGFRAGAYHAGMDGAKREAMQTKFLHGTLDIAVATNAFGMGIDRHDVRAVIHLAPPGSIESYYQEVGRAGRDGLPASGLLFISPSDMPMRRALLEKPGAEHTPSAAVIEHKWNLFLELMRWAEGGSCRHDAILRYFGDESETLHGCGRCDVCLDLADEEVNQIDTQTIVRKALSGVARVHNRFGFKAAVQLLRGVKDDRLARAGLLQIKTFGVLADYKEDWVIALLRRCVTAGWVDFTGKDKPLVLLTERGADVMHGTLPVRLLLPKQHKPASKPATQTKTTPRVATTPIDNELKGKAADIFAALRSYRLSQAQAHGVPPYVVASDKTLRDLAQIKPRNMRELQLVHGIGPAKAERYGADFLKIIAQC